MENNKNNNLIVYISVLFILFVFLGRRFITNSLSQVSCTQEAKICPDGSAVGRNGPSCDYDPCPTVSNSFQTYTNSKYPYQIDYPQDVSPINVSSEFDLDFVDFRSADTTSYAVIRVQKSNLVDAINEVKSQTMGHLVVKIAKEETSLFDNNKIVKLVFESDEQSITTSPPFGYVFIEKNDLVFIIESQALIQDQILSTFKFIN